MIVERKHFPTILPDNDELYLLQIEGIIESVDELCSVEIRRLHNSYSFRIAPSLPKYTNMIIQELFNYNNRLGIKLDMSKSIKTSAIISFQISL
jgi:hypothetical protein